MIEFLIFSSFLHRCHSLSYSPTTIIPKVSEKAETTCCVGLHNTDKLSLHGSKQRSPGHPSEVVLSPDSCKQASLSNLLKLFASHILRELFSLAWSTLYYFSLLSDFKKKIVHLPTPGPTLCFWLCPLPKESDFSKLIILNWSIPSLLPIPPSTVQYHFHPHHPWECTFLRVT